MIKNVKCNGETVTQIVNGSGNKLADLTAEVENEAAYVLPTSTNAGGELTAGSTIAAGTYFSGAATVPSGGGWTPTVANGTVKGAGTSIVTIEHNLGTKNVALFVFSSLAINGGACSAMNYLFSVVFNPETFYKTGYSNTYDCSSFNETVGAATIDWSAESLGVVYQTPYTSGAFNGQNKYIPGSSTFTENSVTFDAYLTLGNGITYYWFAFALPDYTESQKLVIGNSEV